MPSRSSHTPSSLVWLALTCLFVSSAQAAADTAVTDTSDMKEARIMGMTAMQLMQEKLANYDKAEFPGIQAWLVKEAKVFSALSKETPAATWRKLAVEKLVTRNANFWQLFYEIVPGDPGLAMLHAGALLSAGDADRAEVILRLVLHRGDLDKNTRGILSAIMQQCESFKKPSNDLVSEGITLHDKADYKGALAKYDAALKLWPRNGWASFEKGISYLNLNDKKPDSPTRETFADSRHVQPFQWSAWQGDVPDVPGMLNMHKVARPLWDASQKSLGYVMRAEDLLRLAEVLQEAQVDDLALVVRQVYIIRRGRYSQEDHPFISKSLRRLVPGKQTEQTIERLASANMTVAQLFAPPVPAEKE